MPQTRLHWTLGIGWTCQVAAPEGDHDCLPHRPQHCRVIPGIVQPPISILKHRVLPTEELLGKVCDGHDDYLSESVAVDQKGLPGVDMLDSGALSRHLGVGWIAQTLV